jgi:hypothetical protein
MSKFKILITSDVFVHAYTVAFYYFVSLGYGFVQIDLLGISVANPTNLAILDDV